MSDWKRLDCAVQDATKKRSRSDAPADDAGIVNKAMKWAEEFGTLDEDDQYTYLEEMASRMTREHLQFLQGMIGFDDEEEEELDDEDEDDEDDSADDDEAGEDDDDE